MPAAPACFTTALSHFPRNGSERVFLRIRSFCYPAAVVKDRDKKEYFFPVLAFLFFLLIFVPVIVGETFRLAPELLDRAEARYGKEARTLLVAWENLIVQHNSGSDREKIGLVNEFFNRMEFVDDMTHWGVDDYWATPVEFLGTRGGDCEDFSIAKYFTLKAMGLEEEKLNLTYVKALSYNVHHMVLTYYENPGAEPLVLDNIVAEIKPASQRADLIPIYSFNGTGLWLAKQRGRGLMAGSSSRLQRWQDLVERMNADR